MALGDGEGAVSEELGGGVEAAFAGDEATGQGAQGVVGFGAAPAKTAQQAGNPSEDGLAAFGIGAGEEVGVGSAFEGQGPGDFQPFAPVGFKWGDANFAGAIFDRGRAQKLVVMEPVESCLGDFAASQTAR